MMKANGGCARIERAGVRADDALSEIRNLQPFVGEIAFDELGHRPIEQQAARFFIIAEASFQFFARGRLADPHVVFVGRPQGIARAANYVRHGAPAGYVLGRHSRNFGFALRVVIVELNAGAVFERNKETVAGGRPAKPAPDQIELFNNERMEQPGEIRTRRYPNAGPGFFDGAGAADAAAALQDENALSGASEIGRTRQPVMSGAHNQSVPALAREFGNCGQAVRCCSALLWSARAACAAARRAIGTRYGEQET